jgi:hypothetical protein
VRLEEEVTEEGVVERVELSLPIRDGRIGGGPAGPVDVFCGP